MLKAAVAGSMMGFLLWSQGGHAAGDPQPGLPAPSATPSYSALIVTSDANVELLVTDPNGRRTGRDPTSGQSYEEIPASSYGIEGDIGDDEDPQGLPTPAEKHLDIRAPVAGTYVIEVIGVITGPYTLEVDGFDTAGGHSRSISAGTVSPGSRTRYRVTYSATAGAAVRLSPVVPAAAPVETFTKDPSPGGQTWKTYRNTRYGYRVDYPPGAELSGAPAEKVVIAFEVPFATGQDVLTFNATVHANPAGLDAKAWGIRQWDEGSVREIAEVRVSGHPAYRFKVFEYDQDGYHYYLGHRQDIYELDFVDPKTIGELTPAVQQRYQEIFRRMLSSFSFE